MSLTELEEDPSATMISNFLNVWFSKQRNNDRRVLLSSFAGITTVSGFKFIFLKNSTYQAYFIKSPLNCNSNTLKCKV